LTVELVGAYLQAAGLRRIAWPEQVQLVATLPRNMTGKVDKAVLRNALSQRNET
jgi:non-ribosomal peptide synthetase component E (peptide arylation enzyme)